MLVCDALQNFPCDRKGYLVYGNPGAVWLVLKKYFPGAYAVNSSDEVASSAPGTVLIPKEWAECALDYVGLPKSDRTYVFVFEDDESPVDFGLARVRRKFSSLKLPQIDCTNPTKPKERQSVVRFVMAGCNLPEEAARDLAQRTHWDLGSIFHAMYLWTRVTMGKVMAPQQAQNLLETLLPADPESQVVHDILAERFHRLTSETLAQVDPREVLTRLAADLDKMRIVARVLKRDSTMSTLLQGTGLPAHEVKYYIPLARSLKSKKVSQWESDLVWAYAHRNQPKVLDALVAILIGRG